jgi:hypothetical protein
VLLPRHLQGIVITEVPVEHQVGQPEPAGDQVQQGVEHAGDAHQLWRQRHVSFGFVLATLWAPWPTLSAGWGRLFTSRFGLVGRFFCVATHDLLDTDRERASLLRAHQGQREEGQPGNRFAIQTGKEPIQAIGVCARFGGHDLIAHQQVAIVWTVDMPTKEHPKQDGPWEGLGEKALDGAVTATFACPAGEA